MSLPNYERPPMGDAKAKPSKLDRIAKRREAERDEAAHERAVNKIVDARDKGRCRCCGRRGNPNGMTLLDTLHRAHIVDRSLGGVYEPFNLCSLCADCHAAIHAKQLFFIGSDANARLEFEILDPAVEAYVFTFG